MKAETGPLSQSYQLLPLLHDMALEEHRKVSFMKLKINGHEIAHQWQISDEYPSGRWVDLELPVGLPRNATICDVPARGGKKISYTISNILFEGNKPCYYVVEPSKEQLGNGPTQPDHWKALYPLEAILELYTPQNQNAQV